VSPENVAIAMTRLAHEPVASMLGPSCSPREEIRPDAAAKSRWG
jgi:hypothetical protein